MAQATIHGYLVTQAEGLTPEQIENNRLLVGALRSGDYAQGYGCLHPESGTFCCLGVAEDILGANWTLDIKGSFRVKGSSQHEAQGINGPTLATQQQYGFKYWYGFEVEETSDAPTFVASARLFTSLSTINDSRMVSFHQISDLIAYWAGLEEAPDA